MIHELIQNSIRIIPWQARTAIKRFPVVAPLQRMLLARFLEGKEFIHLIDAGPGRGLNFPVVLPEDKGVWTGTYELDFINEIARATRPGSTCFDIGGWRGFCGGVMALQGARSVVIFEPLPVNAERIRRLIDLNPDLPLQMVQAAAGAMDGQATFTVMSATSMGKISECPFQEQASSQGSITVDVFSLDSWCKTNSMAFPEVIKIDVEGAEILVLRGAKKILAESGPILFIEAHSRDLAREIVSFLEPFRYRLRTLESGATPDGRSEPEVCHIVAERHHVRCESRLRSLSTVS